MSRNNFPTILNRISRANLYGYSILLNGTSSWINCGTDSSLANLPLASFTLEMWIKTTKSGTQALLSKIIADVSMLGGWHLELYGSSNILFMQITNLAGTGWAYSKSVQSVSANAWNHIVCAYDISNKKPYFAINGAWCTYSQQDAFVGTYDTDAARIMRMGVWDYGTKTDWFQGEIAWVRISNTLRYTIGTSFNPHNLHVAPAVDGSTVELWRMEESTGSTTVAAVDSGNNGAMTDCLWR